MSVSARPPILVLALGNPLLRDDGVGIELLRRLRERRAEGHIGFTDAIDEIEFVDGGTQGVALLGLLAHRRALLILDAVAMGEHAGEISVLRDPLRHATPQDPSAHGANAAGLLAAASLLGDLPQQTTLVGVRPAELRTGLGLSAVVEQALPAAQSAAEQVLTEWCHSRHTTDSSREGAACMK